ADAGGVAERLAQRLAQRDADVLDRVVEIHREVAGRPQAQVEGRVLRERLEHVVEERNARRDLVLTAAVEVQLESDVGLARLARERRLALHGHRISISASRAASRSRRSRRIFASRRSTERAWPVNPSSSASRISSRPSSRSLGGSKRTKLVRLRKSSTPSGEKKRAVPPVGSTWLG